jgi:cation transport ATPase
MWMAVLADVGTSLVVTANGMRLLRVTDETRF